jgi:hypothetical protein
LLIRKSIFSLSKISKFTQIYAKGSSKQIHTSVMPFVFNFDPKLKIKIFESDVKKIFDKKCALFSAKSRLKRKPQKH